MQRAYWRSPRAFAARHLCHLRQSPAGGTAGAARPSRRRAALHGCRPASPRDRRRRSSAVPLAVAVTLRARAVCTEDGSDPAAVLPKILSPTTPITVRLNGCDMTALGDQERDAIRTVKNHIGRPVVVFVGRLEPYKGCLEFVDAALAVLKGTPDRADFVLVGDGPLRAEMEARVRGAGQSARVRFVGSLAARSGQKLSRGGRHLRVHQHVRQSVECQSRGARGRALSGSANIRSHDPTRHGDRQSSANGCRVALRPRRGFQNRLPRRFPVCLPRRPRSPVAAARPRCLPSG